MKLGIKDVFIIILCIGLVISFIMGQKKAIDYRKGEIEKLHEENEKLVAANDSLVSANQEIDNQFDELVSLVDRQQNSLTKTQSQLDKLKKRKNEIPNYVNYLSANDVADELSTYLERHRKSTSVGN
jgi:peptidoglycan hydrolase CwlO-like protein